MHLAILCSNGRQGVEAMSVPQTMSEDTNALPGRGKRILQSVVNFKNIVCAQLLLDTE